MKSDPDLHNPDPDGASFALPAATNSRFARDKSFRLLISVKRISTT
jgi:hypothetical protein